MPRLQQVFDDVDDVDCNIRQIDQIVKYGTVHVCQKCGGRFSCKAMPHEMNQYGKGVYFARKTTSSQLDR